MKKNVPISNDIEFDTKIAEICSISLEHDYVDDTEGVSGNFIVSGEYKAHEISVNKDSFRHLIPFSINYTNDVTELVDFSIVDFTYDVVSPNILRVNIEFMIDTMEKEIIEDVRVDYKELVNEIEEPKEELITNSDDSYILYNIHIVKEEETIEIICSKYQTSVEYIKEYNDISNIKVGDKLIIPSNNE